MLVYISDNLLADFVVRLNSGIARGVEFILVPYSKTLFDIVGLLYMYGCFKSFSVVSGMDSSFMHIKLYPQYVGTGSVIRSISLVSRPGLRVFWTADELSRQFSRKNVQGFFVISTSKGICSSNELLAAVSLQRAVAGEVFLRVNF